MLIKKLISKYEELGFSIANCRNLAAEEIIISKIAKSPLAEHVTLKGGIIMYNLTKSSRRVTQDIDFDLIHYSIDEESIKLFFKKLNALKDGVSMSIKGKIEKLHQEDYRGVRVNLAIKDIEGTQLEAKLDIGVHTHHLIEQQKIVFCFDNDENTISINANSYEQLFAEKLLSLGRFGPFSTRYKDIYDLYYLVVNNCVDAKKVSYILKVFLSSSNREPNDLNKLVNVILNTFDNSDFAKDASKPISKWINVDYQTVVDTMKPFILKLL